MIGRKREAAELNRLYERDRAELVAIYGRRRVGKTYLVDEVFEGRITFRHAGLLPADVEPRGQLRAQLDHFYNSLVLHGMARCEKPKSWLDAFFLLESFLQSVDASGGNRNPNPRRCALGRWLACERVFVNSGGRSVELGTAHPLRLSAHGLPHLMCHIPSTCELTA